MSNHSPTLQVALAEVRGRVARGELRLRPVPGGQPGEVMVPTSRQIFIVPAEGSTLAAISPDDRRRLEVLHGLACTGAVLVGSSWILALVLFVTGAAVMPALVASGLAALLFAGSILLVPVVTSRPEPVGPEHPLAPDAQRALCRTLAEETAGAPLEMPGRAAARVLASAPIQVPARARGGEPGHAVAGTAGGAVAGTVAGASGAGSGEAPDEAPGRAPEPTRTRSLPQVPTRGPMPTPTPLRARRSAPARSPGSRPAPALRVRPAPSASGPFSPSPPPVVGSIPPAP